MPAGGPPALVTSMSSPPRASRASATNRPAPSAVDRSATNGTAPSPMRAAGLLDARPSTGRRSPPGRPPWPAPGPRRTPNRMTRRRPPPGGRSVLSPFPGTYPSGRKGANAPERDRSDAIGGRSLNVMAAEGGDRWVARPILSALIRLLVVIVPAVAGALAAWEVCPAAAGAVGVRAHRRPGSSRWWRWRWSSSWSSSGGPAPSAAGLVVHPHHGLPRPGPVPGGHRPPGGEQAVPPQGPRPAPAGRVGP